MSEAEVVWVGSKWMSNDKRRPLKSRRANAFEVVAFVTRNRIAHARVRPVSAAGAGHRERLIAVHRFKPNATGYVPLTSGAT